MREEFRRELEDTLYIHSLLPLHREKSVEAAFPGKKVLEQKAVWSKEEQKIAPVCGKAGTLRICSRDGDACIGITAPLESDHWPEGAPEDGDYCNYGRAEVRFPVEREDWSGYNRLHFWVNPQVPGAQIVHLNVGIKNQGNIIIPDLYEREGFQVYDLENNRWNECFWEFPSLPRDCVTELYFYVFLCGRDVTMEPELTYLYKDIRIEKIEKPEKEWGWECAPGDIVLSGAGYFREGEKTAVASLDEETFGVYKAETGACVYTGKIQWLTNEKGTFQILDFTRVCEEGFYYLQAGEYKSQLFEIAEDIVEENVWRVVNFLYAQRCGMPIEGKHGTCHQDIVARHQGVTITYAGGWHDAGDASQQTAQTGEIVHALLEMASKYKTRSPKLYKRLLEEASWGLDFILRTRFGDGYRATSAGATRWTNNRIGDMDDVEARVYNHAYENALFAGIEGYAGMVLREENEAAAWGSLQAAREDLEFAERRFETHGLEVVQMFEHTYNSGLSQYYAVFVWAASILYEATGEREYAGKAEYWCDRLLACQETGAAGLPFTGFFYRDEKQDTIVHFNHQARDHQFMQALVEICRSQPDADRKPVWEEGIKRYAGYLKALEAYAKPYGMIPSGVYRKDEYLNKELFPYLHLGCEYEAEKENYKEQLEKGIPVGEDHVIRNFPVWFSFRGNTLPILSEGKAASLAGRYLGDETLLQIGREQLYWIFGKNPFGHSLLYGAGGRYPSQYAVFPGESVGEMPVGIETKGNEDIPYWPQGNNATYREIWTSTASRWLWLAADYVKN